jgi:hypothetical protein
MTVNDPAVAGSVLEPTLSPIVELRQYTLHPGKRDVLIDLFDREFIESQETLGMTVIGQFRDCDDPDHFVWLRGFSDMATRAEGLHSFYGGPVWKQHRDAANATMIDSDNVLLLRPAQGDSGFSPPVGSRPPRGTGGNGPGLVVATIHSVDDSVANDVVDDTAGEVRSALIDAGATVLAMFVTHPGPNTFPGLPVRDGENVLVWFAGFADVGTGLRWSEDHATLDLSPPHAHRLQGPTQRLHLTPTARSLLTGASPACPAVTR